jgi:hypothetical protein
VIGRGDMVTEEAETDGPRGLLPDGRHRSTDLVAAERGARERTKSSGIRDGDHHLDRNAARHRRLNDWQLDAKKIEDAGVWP